ncbi:RNA methyltransferase, putative [Plasmodium vinckei brucechwatti]|uniref:16S rRNA (uracil(1498)-N(3))-methyltransferase n=1 Tax=Plasmodium vinckei brucechwatti TaxID=119398 RepID=A0A6V7SBN8_PLAVN|nr:RNA methyltransferase, putative [Plasmodium vinckei brucechwatti]
MNLILISANIIYKNDGDYLFKTDGRQTSHLKSILKVKLNQVIKVGVINKGKGEGIILEENPNFYIIKLLTPIHLEKPQNNFLPIDVVLCIPRPKVLNKALQQLSSVGVKKIIIVFSEYSNKCYESSKMLKNDEIKLALQLGLEQAMCTSFPKVYMHYTFSSFFMNIQNYCDENTIKVCAHTDIKKKNEYPLEHSILNKEKGKILLMLGCERGFSDLEIYLLQKLNFNFLNLSERILKCETALLIIIGKLLLLTENVSLRPNGKKMVRWSSKKESYNMTNVNETDFNIDSNESTKQEKKINSDFDFQNKAELIKKIKNILTDPDMPEQLINSMTDFIRNQENDEHVNKNNDGENNNLHEQNDHIINSILRIIKSFNNEEENNFQCAYLSLLLKKIKYKNQLDTSYNDIKNNVDQDGVFIYRTQRYMSKKKNS